MKQSHSCPPDANIDSYKGYKGLPPIVGIATLSEVVSSGLAVSEAVDRLKRMHWALKRLHHIFVLRITSMPVYELKMAFSLHSYYCVEHLGKFAHRVREMREPPYGLENSPHPQLDSFFDEILAAPTVEAFVLGVYERAIPALVQSLERFIRDTNHLFDHPSYRICRFALLEMQEVQAYGLEASRCLVDATHRAELETWLATLDRMLAASGGLDGTSPASEESVERKFSTTPYHYDPIPQRDERFKDSYNMGVNAEAMLLDSEIEARPKTIMLYFKRMREIDVPEMMASILAEETDKPWEYQLDMTRQLWDEARHAMMGEVGFISLGVDWTEVPLNFTWSLGLNTRLTALERHAVLYTIEQGLMPRKTGKMHEWKVALATQDPLSAIIQDYDWADEVLHAKIGRDWLVPQLGSQVKALAYGDKAWSDVLVDWAKWRDQGLTEHRNWWPDVYRKACEHWRIHPDPILLAYDKTYEETRADLKQVVS